MILVFEDDGNSPISKLLKYYLGNSVIFSKGDRNIENVIDDLLNNSCIDIICFIDCITDNGDAVTLYNSLSLKYADIVKIIPIPCIELFAYVLLDKLAINRKFVNACPEILDYCLNKTDLRPDSMYIQSSFERYIKALTEVQPSCINTNSYGSTNKGKFYILDCNCGDKYCKLIKGSISMFAKFRYLYSLLPEAYKYDIDTGKLINEVIKTIEIDFDKFYDRMIYFCELNNLRKRREGNLNN